MNRNVRYRPKSSVPHRIFRATCGLLVEPLLYPALGVGDAVQDCAGEEVERPVESYENVADAVYAGIGAVGPDWMSELEE
jgi:hypothetical protein